MELATIELMDNIIQNMDNTRITKKHHSPYVYLSKAFDTIILIISYINYNIMV